MIREVFGHLEMITRPEPWKQRANCGGRHATVFRRGRIMGETRWVNQSLVFVPTHGAIQNGLTPSELIDLANWMRAYNRGETP